VGGSARLLVVEDHRRADVGDAAAAAYGRYLHKPLTLDELMSMIGDILAQGRSWPQPAAAPPGPGVRPTIT